MELEPKTPTSGEWNVLRIAWRRSWAVFWEGWHKFLFAFLALMSGAWIAVRARDWSYAKEQIVVPALIGIGAFLAAALGIFIVVLLVSCVQVLTRAPGRIRALEADRNGRLTNEQASVQREDAYERGLAKANELASERVGKAQADYRAKLKEALDECATKYKGWTEEKAKLIDESYDLKHERDELKREIEALVGRLPLARERLRLRARTFREWHRHGVACEAEVVRAAIEATELDIGTIMGEYDLGEFRNFHKRLRLDIIPATETLRDGTSRQRFYIPHHDLGKIADWLIVVADDPKLGDKVRTDYRDLEPWEE